MTQELEVTDIKFINLFMYEKAISLLTPISTTGNLNSAVIFDNENSCIYFVIKDVTSFIKITLPMKLSKWDFTDSKVGFQIDLKKFMYTITQYSDDYSSVKIIIKNEDLKNKFSIKSGKDVVTLPVLSQPLALVEEALALFSEEIQEDEMYSFSLTDSKDFLLSLHSTLKNSLALIGREEQVNNACAIYSDHLVVNDKRHIYIQKFKDKITQYDSLDEKFISLHKKNMRIFNETLNTEGEYSLIISKNNSKVYIKTKNFMGVFNNKLANSYPPSDEDLEGIQPKELIYKSPVNSLLKACTFFSGFYSSASDIRALSFKQGKDNELLLFLKDAGVAGFGEYSIEKILESTVPTNSSEVEKEASTIIYDSLKDFLTKEEPDSIVEFYYDPNKRAVYLKGENSEIYLSKLQG